MSKSNPPKRRRWLMPLLAVSLAVNLLIVGMAAGAIWRVKDMGGGKMRSGPAGIAFLRALEPDDRKALFSELRESREAGRNFEREVGASILAALRVDPFGASDLQMLMNARATKASEAKAILDAKWLSIVSQMSPADRAAYADRLETALERRKHGGIKRQDD